MNIVKYTAKNEGVNNSQDITVIPGVNIGGLVDAFISSQDVKHSSKQLYRRGSASNQIDYTTWILCINYVGVAGIMRLFEKTNMNSQSADSTLNVNKSTFFPLHHKPELSWSLLVKLDPRETKLIQQASI